MTPVLCYHPPSGAPSFSGEEFPKSGVLVYWPSVNMLVQGAAPPTDDPNFSGDEVILQQQHVSALPENAIVAVMIWQRGLSFWERVHDTSFPATDTDLAGVIVPTEYHPVLSPFLLHRVGGF